MNRPPRFSRHAITGILLSCVACSASPSRRVGETIRQLQAFTIDRSDPDTLPDPQIPIKAKPLLTQLKHDLRDAIAERVNATADAAAHVEQIQTAVRRALPAEAHLGVGVDVEVDEARYGRVEGIRVQRPNADQDLIVATTTLWVMCGSDTSLYVLQRKDTRWQVTLSIESNDYKDVSGALGRFTYRVSGIRPDGSVVVVIADVNPWCSSNWQRLRYRAFVVGA